MCCNILCRNIHTVPRQGEGPGPIVSYCVSPIPCGVLVFLNFPHFSLERAETWSVGATESEVEYAISM